MMKQQHILKEINEEQEFQSSMYHMCITYLKRVYIIQNVPDDLIPLVRPKVGRSCPS